MLLWIAQVALATTLTVPGGVTVSGEQTEVRAPVCAAVDGDVRCTLSGGWVRLVSSGSREELWLHPDWDVRLLEDGRAEGKGADEIRAQREVRVWVASQEPTTIAEAGSLAKKLRSRAEKVQASPEVRARIVDYGLASLATSVVEQTETGVLFEDETFYPRLSAALGLRPEVAKVPYFWSFGWSYGRMAGGVKAFGAEEAVRRIVARTDATGRHPSVAGALDWAIESATTKEELQALDRALAAWKEAGAPPMVLGHYTAKAREKQATGPGQPAPALAGKGMDGAQHDLTELNGPVVIDFWGSWCAPCIASIPKMKALQSEWGDRVTFLALASEDQSAGPRWRATVKKHGWTDGFVHWMHWDRTQNQRWSISRWPSYVVLDSSHRIVSFASSADDLGPIIAKAVESSE